MFNVKKIKWGGLFLACLITSGVVFARCGRLKSDEFVLFMPGLAVEQKDGSFNVEVSAWVFEKESRRLVVSMLIAWMETDFDE
ncbi:MAG: hypothetical protein LBI31_04280 [Zoogloeaceae bacterium]|jgi:hypothetical protein|nr:hypothetical protein [Zoogloeaceae bacterium]